MKYTSLGARVARLASPSEKLLTSAPVSRVVRVLCSREANASIGQSVARLARVPRADARRPERPRARETPRARDETRRETRATALARVLERGTHEIFHRAAVDERGHEDTERGEESDRSRGQTESALDHLAREAVGLDEGVGFHPRGVATGHVREASARARGSEGIVSGETPSVQIGARCFMRVRARETRADGAKGETQRVDLASNATLGDLRARVVSLVGEDGTTAANSIRVRLSLNGRDELGGGASGAERASLTSLGVAGGDLVRFEVVRDREVVMEDAVPVSADEAAAPSSSGNRASGADEEMPRTMRETLKEWSGALEASELVFLAIYAMMLDAGAKTLGAVELRDGLARRGCYGVRYEMGVPGTSDTVACSLRAQPVDGHLSVFGALESDASVAYAASVPTNEYARGNEISAERCRALWDTVRKTMANKLFDAVKAQVAGVLASGTLMSLPTEVKRRVAEKLDAYGLAYCSCTCRELRKVCASNDLWQELLRKDFGIEHGGRDGLHARTLYNLHAIRRTEERDAALRMESYHPMPGRLPRHGLGPDADRDIYPGIPGHVPGIIGGDYDLWPGGLNPNPPPRPIPGYGRGGLGGPGRPRGGWPGGGPPFPPQPGGLPYNPDPDADLRNPPDIPGGGRPGFPNMPPNPGYDGRPRPPPDYF